MSKRDEREFPDRLADVLGVPQADVRRYLLEKPFADSLRSRYFIDFGQIVGLLPATGRVLDLGAGSGWTSRFLARCGYEVVGMDISETMIAHAIEASPGIPGVSFAALDYELPFPQLGMFDAALIYDALHHAEDEAAVIDNVFNALRPGGLFITAEPGLGHAAHATSIEAVQRFGVTEKDMDCAHQRELMLAAGFAQVRCYPRLSELSIVDVSKDSGADQRVHLEGLVFNTVNMGISSIVAAIKD